MMCNVKTTLACLCMVITAFALHNARAQVTDDMVERVRADIRDARAKLDSAESGLDAISAAIVAPEPPEPPVEPPPPPSSTGLTCPDTPAGEYWSTTYWLCNQAPDEASSPELTPPARKFSVTTFNRVSDRTVPYTPGFVVVKLHASSKKGGFVHGGTPFRAPIPGIGFDNRSSQLTVEDAQIQGCTEWWSAAGCGKPVGLYATQRVANVLSYFYEHWPEAIDPSLGLVITGTSMGAHGAYAMAATLPEPYRSRIVALHTRTGFNITTNADGTPFAPLWAKLVNSDGGTSAASRAVNMAGRWGEHRDIYITAMFGAQDTLTTPNPALISELQAERIAHCAIMHGGSHQGTYPSEVQPCKTQWVSLGTPHVAFTQSSADIPFFVSGSPQTGRINLGLGWDGYRSTDSENEARILIRYKHDETPVGPQEPMPLEVDVMVTPKRVNLTPGAVVAWSYQDQSGTATADVNGEITFPLRMVSGDAYLPLVINK